jgi:hypothetical protein
MPKSSISVNAMTNAIIAHLSSDTYCSALNFTARSPSPVLTLCRQLIESGTYGSSIPLDAYRGATLCLRVRSIGEGAALEISGNGIGFRSPQGPAAVGIASLVSPST